jgi:leader peptidase (prepilin peptidase)/N-methyltransferase
VEGLTGLFFALLYWKFGLGLELAISLLYVSLLIIIFLIDLENQLVLDKVTYPAMVLAFAFSCLFLFLARHGNTRFIRSGECKTGDDV